MKQFRSINRDVRYKALSKYSLVMQLHVIPINTLDIEQQQISTLFCSAERVTSKKGILKQPTIQSPSCFYIPFVISPLPIIDLNKTP